MAQVIVKELDQQVSPDGAGVQLLFRVLYFGPDIPGGGADQSEYQTLIAAGDTLNAMMTKIREGLAADAARWGYTYTPSRVIFPGYTRG